MGRKIEIEQGTYSDIKLVIWDNDRQSQALHLTYDELDAIVAGAKKLRQSSTFDAGLTDQTCEELARETEEYHVCDHFHTGGECPVTPCGDYRCCIN